MARRSRNIRRFGTRVANHLGDIKRTVMSSIPATIHRRWQRRASSSSSSSSSASSSSSTSDASTNDRRRRRWGFLYGVAHVSLADIWYAVTFGIPVWIMRRWRRLVSSSSSSSSSSSTSSSTSRAASFVALIEPMPALPAARPRLLTPSASREDLGLVQTETAAAAATAKSLLFTRLPVELRRRILVEAFGGRVVHMDLWYGRQPRPPPRYWAEASDGAVQIISHCNYFMPEPRMHINLPSRWYWRSSECHRLPPENHILRDAQGRISEDYWNAAEDRCLQGNNFDLRKTCRLWCAGDPSRCFIGAMGWLQSCRQAYSEGIDVLYGSNTIHTSSKRMICHLDKLLLPQRLARIKSVEIVWEFEPSHRLNLNSYYDFLNTLPTMFPNALSLLVCLQGHLNRYQPELDGDDLHQVLADPLTGYAKLTEDKLMGPMDAMVRKLPCTLQSFSVAISSGLYAVLQRQARNQGLTVERVREGAKVQRFWRPLADKRPNVSSTERTGYWIQLGRRDRPWNWETTEREYSLTQLPERDDVFNRRRGRP